MQGHKTPQYTGDPIGSGGSKDSYTQADAAAMCAGHMHRKHWLAGRLRWLMDKTVAMELEHYLFSEVAGYAARENWVLVPKQPLMRALAGLAIAEVLFPVMYSQDVYRVEWYSRRTKIPRDRVFQSWERIWRGRYQAAAWAPLERWSEVAAEHIYFRQREPQDIVVEKP